MPTTLVGLVIFTSLLTPGFLSYIQRRRLVPTHALSPLVETATLTTVSLLTNVLVLGLFGLIRLTIPAHTPNVGALLHSPGDYALKHLPYVATWGAGLLIASSCLGFAIGARSSWLSHFRVGGLTPEIYDVSAWYHLFEAPPDQRVYVGCDLRGGGYIGGVVDWYSTETVETGDRDLVLGPPLTKVVDGEPKGIDPVERVVISARDITTMYVSYLEAPPPAGSWEH